MSPFYLNHRSLPSAGHWFIKWLVAVRLDPQSKKEILSTNYANRNASKDLSYFRYREAEYCHYAIRGQLDACITKEGDSDAFLGLPQAGDSARFLGASAE